MKRPAILHSLKARLQPARWGAFAAFLVLLGLLRLLLGDLPSLRDLPHFLHGLLLVVTMVALAPLPWQWTGDDRRKAPLLRGVGQALVWNTAWLALVLGLFGPDRHSAIQAAFSRFHRAANLPVQFLALLGLLSVAFLLGWIIAELQAAEGDREEALTARRSLELSARQAQEQALKAQLDPHVLYNALGGICELIREDPDRAEESLQSLAELYRTLTAMGRRETVTLAEERGLITDYLAVEQVRLGDRLRVAWDWPAALDTLEVPPLLLQPLVENAIKHGLAPRKQGGDLRLTAAQDGPGLRFTVADNGEPLDPAHPTGLGLGNLAARLALLGGGSGFELRQRDTWTIAELRLWPGGRP